MGIFYKSRLEASRDFERRRIDSQYVPFEERGSSFVGNPCVKSDVKLNRRKRIK